MKQTIQKYLDDKKLAWSPNTLKSEEHRLNAVAHLLDGNARKLWDGIEHLGAYSRLTTWSRVCDFWEWAFSEKLVENQGDYRAFRKKNAKQFKNVYTPKTPDISYEEALARIETLRPEVRAKAAQLLSGGLRYTESFTLSAGRVVGKGNKTRKAFTKEATYTLSYRTLLRALQHVGLTPHMLRKICATRLAREGLREADLCKVFGWSSFKTAAVYLAPLQDEAIAEKFSHVQGGTHDKKTTRKPLS
jgi:integrase